MHTIVCITPGPTLPQKPFFKQPFFKSDSERRKLRDNQEKRYA